MALEEMEKKKTTNVSVYFPWTLLAYQLNSNFVIYRSEWGG